VATNLVLNHLQRYRRWWSYFMNTLMTRSLMALLPAVLCAMASIAQAQPAAPEAPSADAPERHEWYQHHHWHERHEWHGGDDNELVSVGHDSHLPAGQRAQSVVSVLGSAISEGEAEDVVSVFGNTRVTGPVDDSAVAVFGNSYVDSRIGGDAVAVLGDIELGPHADVGGDVVAIGGTLKRDPAAIIHGDLQTVFAGHFGGFEWLRPWIKHCLLYGRPLALRPSVGWAWGVALSFLALYVFLALLFRASVSQCVQTFESKPGQSVVAALLTVLLSPIVLTLLCITVIGIAAVPFVVVGLFCAGLFGKAVMLAWLGRRCVGRHDAGPLGHPALAVLIGGVIVLALYLVPVLGFVVYKLLGLLGLGAVVYTLIQAVRARRASGGVEQHVPQPPAAPSAPAQAAAPGPASAPSAAATTPAVTAALPRAGFWIRMAALLLDALLVGILIGLLHHLFNLELLVLAAYGAVMWKLRGSTIGGIVFDLQVVRQDGREIDWATAIVRALGCFLSLAAAGLGFIWIAFDDGKQAWHDKIAGTVVVRVAKGVSLV
jgi:uncharacterized RDD family membrane protein YckC